MHDGGLPGKPDFVFTRARVAVFVDGCFWHGCPKCYRRPATNQQYWDEKVRRNKARDASRRRKLRKLGWSVIQLWEHEVKERPDFCVRRVGQAIGRKA